MDDVGIGLVQHACGPDPEENRKRTMEGIRRAAGQGARIVCTQELFATTYFCQEEREAHFSLSEPVPGPTTRSLQTLAADLGVVILASLFEERQPGVHHNTAVVVDADGSFLGRYRKMHIPQDPGFREKYYFAPGDLGFPVWRTRFARIGLLICWDQWFPEAARLMALQGAGILFYPTAIGWLAEEKAALGERQRDAWVTMQRSHAIANGCYVAAVNRVGTEGGIEFWGSSFAADPFGEVLARASGESDEVLHVRMDPGEIRSARTGWPFLRDRRIDAYRGLLDRCLDR